MQAFATKRITVGPDLEETFKENLTNLQSGVGWLALPSERKYFLVENALGEVYFLMETSLVGMARPYDNQQYVSHRGHGLASPTLRKWRGTLEYVDGQWTLELPLS